MNFLAFCLPRFSPPTLNGEVSGFHRLRTSRTRLLGGLGLLAVLAALLTIPLAVYAQSDATAPSNLTAQIVDNGIALSWDAPAEDAGSVTGYEILRRRPNQGENRLIALVANTGSTATTYTDTTAIAIGERYVYRVKAWRDAEKSKRSNRVRVNLPDVIPEQAAGPPAQPQGLSATVTHNSVSLSWDDPADDTITGYQILRLDRDVDEPGDFQVVVNDTGSAAAYYYDKHVSAETRYSYAISARSATGLSEASASFDADTPASPTPEPTPEPAEKPQGEPDDQSDEQLRRSHTPAHETLQEAFDQCVDDWRAGRRNIAYCATGGGPVTRGGRHAPLSDREYGHLTTVYKNGDYDIDWSWWDTHLEGEYGAPDGYSLKYTPMTYRHLSPSPSESWYKADSCEQVDTPGFAGWECERFTKNEFLSGARHFLENNPRSIVSWTTGSLRTTGTGTEDLDYYVLTDAQRKNDADGTIYDVEDSRLTQTDVTVWHMDLWEIIAHYSDRENKGLSVLVSGANGFQ